MQLSSSDTITIAVDAMGGDIGPCVTVPACVRALSLMPDVSFKVFGDETLIHQALDGSPLPSRFSIVPTTQVIGMDEKPSRSLRSQRDSSLYKAIQALSELQVQACVSAGNTGSMLAIGCYLLRTFAGIDRPAICTSIPTREGRCFLLDVGANVDVHADNLRQFAVMGSVLASMLLNKQNPSVALLNIGAEDIKGNEQVKMASTLLQSDAALNYIGFIEADQLFFDRVDVVVCDGFVGNIALKTGEGAAQLIAGQLHQVFCRNLFTRFAGLLMKKPLAELYDRINPARYNGASFLGLQATLVKSHGSATVEGFVRALEQARLEVVAGIPRLINERLEYSI